MNSVHLHKNGRVITQATLEVLLKMACFARSTNCSVIFKGNYRDLKFLAVAKMMRHNLGSFRMYLLIEKGPGKKNQIPF